MKGDAAGFQQHFQQVDLSLFLDLSTTRASLALAAPIATTTIFETKGKPWLHFSTPPIAIAAIARTFTRRTVSVRHAIPQPLNNGLKLQIVANRFLVELDSGPPRIHSSSEGIAMGLFKSVLGGSRAYPSSEAEAVMGVLIAVIAADGNISDDEVDSFIYLANNTKTLGPMPQATFKDNVDTCLSVIRREGSSALMERCVPLITSGRRQPLFVNACDLIMRDGRVEPEEEALVEGLQSKLGIEAAFAEQSVTAILAKYNL